VEVRKGRFRRLRVNSWTKTSQRKKKRRRDGKKSFRTGCPPKRTEKEVAVKNGGELLISSPGVPGMGVTGGKKSCQ